jgi:hypothetical protein
MMSKCENVLYMLPLLENFIFSQKGEIPEKNLPLWLKCEIKSGLKLKGLLGGGGRG